MTALFFQQRWIHCFQHFHSAVITLHCIMNSTLGQQLINDESLAFETGNTPQTKTIARTKFSICTAFSRYLLQFSLQFCNQTIHFPQVREEHVKSSGYTSHEENVLTIRLFERDTLYHG